ncbi:ATPase domain-containing protein [Almyronema epifaneia]|uniref:non-specific serine/threonine protein kinase n=1 Tax=Almyronema epifaneia S1 TaxID=2991925 RepID=A0ABW6IHP1_9CYAN
MLQERVSTGIVGLDEILHGGFVSGRAYLLRGGPGTGKTTVGLHFLVEGVAQQEKVLFITLSESESQIRQNANYLGVDLVGIEFLDLSPTPEFFAESQSYDIFSPADVEREPTTQKIMECIEALQPSRIFLDSITQFRYLSTDEFQFHKQALSFIRYLTQNGATVLFTSEGSQSAPDDDLKFMSDGVLSLSYEQGERLLSVTKFRGSDFSEGNHSLRLTSNGMTVFPQLRPVEFQRHFKPETISSGVPELDELLHGGIERGAITIVTGPTGVGKTTFGLQFMKEAAGRGERSVVYTFEETTETILHRCESINIPVRAMLERGTLAIMEIEALLYSPDEFAQLVRQEVEQHQTQIVMIDSLAGYELSIRSGNMVRHVHALCKYLQNMGVATLLINEIEDIAGGTFRATNMGVSYLADNIIFLRHLEIKGELRKAIGVLKKRLSGFERTLRELEITRYGIKVGSPLSKLRNILSGVPDWTDDSNS